MTLPHTIDPLINFIIIHMRPVLFCHCFPGCPIRIMDKRIPSYRGSVLFIDIPIITNIIDFRTDIIPYLCLKITDWSMAKKCLIGSFIFLLCSSEDDHLRPRYYWRILFLKCFIWIGAMSVKFCNSHSTTSPLSENCHRFKLIKPSIQVFFQFRNQSCNVRLVGHLCFHSVCVNVNLIIRYVYK